MSMRHCLRPWKDEYQLLCSIDSVSGDMKSISPFQVPRHLDLDNQTATSIESHFKVIVDINDYQESKAFRAKLSGAVSSFWSLEANSSALDSAKVNSKDIFGYYSLLFTKSRVVVSSSTLCNLPLSREAEKALRCGRFRETYGDMIVVGFITGGEAEAVMKVTDFKEERRDAICKALHVALQNNATNSTGAQSQAEGAVAAIANAAVGAATSTVAPVGVAAGYARGLDEVQALQEATTTFLSRRTGVTHQDQLHNPNNFPELLYQLTKAPENTGVKISALCYKVELFSQVPVDVLGFARAVVDENVNTLQKQFAQAQFVYNSCEAHLAPGADSSRTPDNIMKEFRKLRRDASEAMQRFAHFKGYRDVGLLSANDFTRRIGSQLVQRFEDLCEQMRVAEVKAQAQQQLARSTLANRPSEPAKKVEAEDMADMWRGGSGSCAGALPEVPSTPIPWADPPSPAVKRPLPQQTTSFSDGLLQGRLLAGRNFGSGKVLSVQPYVVIKLDGKTITTPTTSGAKSNATVFWHYEFHFEVPAKLLSDDGALVLEVYDKNTLMADRYLGAVTVPLRLVCGHAAQLGAMGKFSGMLAGAHRSKPKWYPVEKVDSGKYKCRGELQLSLTFTTDLTSLQQVSQPPAKAYDGDAEVPLSHRLMRPLFNNLRPGLITAQPVPLPQPSLASNASASLVAYPTIDSISNVSIGIPVSPGPFPSWSPCDSTPLAAGAPGLAAPVALVQEPYRGADGDCGSGSRGVKLSRHLPAILTPFVSHEQSLAKAVSTDDDEEKGSDGQESSDDEMKPRSAAGCASAAVVHEQGTKGEVAVVQLHADAFSVAAVAAATSGQGATTGNGEPAETKKLAQLQKGRPQTRQQALESKAPSKERRGRGVLGLLLKLTVTGAVLGSAGAAAVVVGHRRFGVDLVVESRRLAVQYGEIVRHKAALWARDGSSTVQSWTRQVASKLRRRQQTNGGAGEAESCGGAVVAAAAAAAQ